MARSKKNAARLGAHLVFAVTAEFGMIQGLQTGGTMGRNYE